MYSQALPRGNASGEASAESDTKAVVASGQLFPAWETTLTPFKMIFAKTLFALHESRRREGERLICQYRHLISD